MDTAKCAAKFRHHIVKGDFERRAPSDQHVVVAGTKRRRRCQPNEFAQAPPYPVALHSVSDLSRDGKANPGRTGLCLGACLQSKGACMRTRALAGGLGDGPKLTPAFQPLHFNRLWRDRVNDNGLQSMRPKCARPALSPFRRSAACVPATAARLTLCDRLWSPYACESRGGACAPICWADRSVSRQVSAAPVSTFRDQGRAAAISRRDWRGLYGRCCGPSM